MPNLPKVRLKERKHHLEAGFWVTEHIALLPLKGAAKLLVHGSDGQHMTFYLNVDSLGWLLRKLPDLMIACQERPEQKGDQDYGTEDRAGD